jgi:hypothetical protein
MTAGATAATSQGDLSVNGDPSSVPVGANSKGRESGGATVLGFSKDLPSINRSTAEPAFLSGSLANAGLHLQGLYPQKAPTREPSAEGRGRRKPG